MAANQKAKQQKGIKNDARKNGKGWKRGLSPEDREAERLARRTPEQIARADARREARVAKQSERAQRMLGTPETSGD